MAQHDIPMLKPNDAMIERALAAGDRIAVVATVAATVPSVSAEIEVMAAGDGVSHDQLVAEAARAIEAVDVIVLAQFTLSRAAPSVEAVATVPVLNSPGAAVAKLKTLLAA